jgi:hypothetical protein
MIGEGMKVRFIPMFAQSKIDDEAEKRRKTVTGTITYINWEHRMFWVEFDCGGSKQKESFHLWDIGNGVKLLG